MIAFHRYFMPFALIVVLASLSPTTSAIKHANEKDELSVIKDSHFEDEVFNDVSGMIP